MSKDRPIVVLIDGRADVYLREFAGKLEEDIHQQVGTLMTRNYPLEKRLLSDEMERAESNGVRYAIVFGKQNELRGTVSLHILRPGRRPEGVFDLYYLIVVVSFS